MKNKVPVTQKLHFYKEPTYEKICEFITKFNIQFENDQSTNPIVNKNGENVDDIISCVLSKKPSENTSEFVNEYEQFIQFGTLGPALSKLKEVLGLIKPTSTDCERIFSTCACVYTKFRSSLDHETLNCIVCLKRFFTNNSF